MQGVEIETGRTESLDKVAQVTRARSRSTAEEIPRVERSSQCDRALLPNDTAAVRQERRR